MGMVESGIIAAALQVAGYLFYGSKVLREDILPNPASWLMFAYGTLFLFIVEWDRDASFAILALPAACAISSIAVALYTLRKQRGWWPEHILEKFSFGLDILLTVAYVSAWFFFTGDLISADMREAATIIILLCWNVGIFTSFFPLLRQVYHHPRTEHALPWIVWTGAYVMLATVTVMEVGGINELFLYPVINACVHGLIAIRTAYWHHSHGLSIV